MKALILRALAAFALFVAPGVTFGSCAVPDLMKVRLSVNMASAQAQVPDAQDQSAAASDSAHVSIVGLWNIQFVSGGQVVDQGFDAWQSDGLEVLNDTPPPATGNVCLGVYEQTGPRTFKLKHPSWIYDQSNTNAIGVATIRETVTVNRSGDQFAGVFTIDFVDFFGNSLGHADGSIKATRITVD